MARERCGNSATRCFWKAHFADAPVSPLVGVRAANSLIGGRFGFAGLRDWLQRSRLIGRTGMHRKGLRARLAAWRRSNKMCGIVAMFSQHGSVTAESLQRASRSLRHRGPDGQRYWIAPDCRVGLGHARLSIIDLTTGDQPIANEDETLRIIVNGEF